MNSDPVFFLIYSSSEAVPFSREQLVDLLTVCRRNNQALGVTGLLLYKGGSFMQAIEGEERTVLALHEKLLLDPRHRQISTLLKGRQEARHFSEWSMGFRDLSSSDMTSVAGYSEFLNTSLNDTTFSDNPSRAQKLLLIFKEIMR